MLNTEYLIFHLETVNNPEEIINEIHSYGIKCGISIKPDTEVIKLKPYLEKIEQVLVMSVEPGAGGQEFMPEMIQRLMI